MHHSQGSGHILARAGDRLEAAVPLIIGANLGTCITAIIACIGLSRESKQVALAHTLFKATGAMIVVWFIPQIVDLVESMSLHASPDSTSQTYSPATIARQIANVHTVYNLVIALFAGSIFPELSIY